VGSDNREDGEQVAALYAAVRAPVIHCSIETAEMVKYACNAFHALKVTFANEIGILAQSLAVDSREVMNIVCRDTKLNISPRYMMPGFAFGGSCLPKDLRALVQTARRRDLDLPLINAIGESNRLQINRALDLVLSTRKKKIAVLGLSFKAGTDDLRESPLVTLTEALLGKGLDVRIYDQSVSLTKLVGANQQYAAKELPHLSSLMGDDLGEVLRHGEVVIVGNSSPEFQQLPLLCHDRQIVIDLVGIDGFSQRPAIHYQGVAW
jgi:GDP-mannose 6-dehydrogenase